MTVPHMFALMATGGAAGPPDPTTDDFNRADSTNLGADWVERESDWVIGSNELRASSVDTQIQWAYDLGTPDMWAEVDMVTGDASTRSGSIILRMPGDGTETYYMGRYFFANSRWEIYKRVAGTFTLLASNTSDDPSHPYRLRFEAEGSDLRLYEVIAGTPTLRLSDTDSSITTGNYAGMRNTATSGTYVVDNWEVGTL
jgi:hypothetical protein